MAEHSGSGLIVVGVDGSDTSVAALEWAVDEARTRGSRVLAITAFDIPWTIMIVPTYTESDYGRDAQAMLDQTMEKFREGNPDLTSVPLETRLVQRRPALALAEAARDADLLVVGSHGYGALSGMHLGSVATYCVHHAPCPVVVHRTRES
jgi:nucleotide-binding universal stress UspA family protein